MSTFRVLQLPDVRYATIQAACEAKGYPWADACHVTAGGGLARALRAKGHYAHAISQFVDRLSLPAMPAGIAIAPSSFPEASKFGDPRAKAYEDALSQWVQTAQGCRVHMGVAFDQGLRDVLRAMPSTPGHGEVLYGARQLFFRSVMSLAAAGVEPADLCVQEPFAKFARDVWGLLEKRVPFMDVLRRDLWRDLKSFREGATASDRELQARLEASVTALFGPASPSGRRHLIHHGFFFYTPPQWALFRLLAEVPGYEQTFVVHSDGSNPAFEIWEHFFNERWGLPRPSETPAPSKASPAAEALLQSLQGRKVEPAPLNGHLRIHEFASPAEFVTELRLASGTLGVQQGGAASQPRVFAADPDTVSRYIERLGSGFSDGGVDLAQLPVGAFLLNLHSCLRVLPGGHGVVPEITSQRVRDIAASGFLQVPMDDCGDIAPYSVLPRALPFFEGCSDVHQWRSRAQHLRTLVATEISALAGRMGGLDDIVRMQQAAANPLRTVPWGDLTVGEAEWFQRVIEALTARLEALARSPQVDLKTFMSHMQDELRKGMKHLSPEEYALVEAKLRGFGLPANEPMDIAGILDVVRMLMGREVAFEALGDDRDATGAVAAMSGVDSLSLERSTRPVHIANLADGRFPSKVTAVGWPFRVDDISPERAHCVVSRELLRTREETAVLADLYQLWVGLDGVEAGTPVTLSWISEVAGEPLNPSAVLSLLTEPAPHSWGEVLDLTGGLSVTTRTTTDGQVMKGAIEMPEPAKLRPNSKVSRANGAKLVGEKATSAAASAHVCPRRFAIQWAMGTSAAFTQEHHHRMLYANAIGALTWQHGFVRDRAAELCDSLWRHLSAAEKASSRTHARIFPKGVKASAKPEWLLTLSGAKDPKKKDAFSLAYQAAINRDGRVAHVLGGEEAAVLPGTPRAAEGICIHCPVKSRCLIAVNPRDGM